MKLTPPKKATFWAALAIAILSIIGYGLHAYVFTTVPFLGGAFFLLLLVAFGLLFLGLILKGL